MDFTRRKRHVEARQSAYRAVGLVNTVEPHGRRRVAG